MKRSLGRQSSKRKSASERGKSESRCAENLATLSSKSKQGHRASRGQYVEYRKWVQPAYSSRSSKLSGDREHAVSCHFLAVCTAPKILHLSCTGHSVNEWSG